MIKLGDGRGQAKEKRRVYLVATLATVGIFLPFQGQTWALYVSACVGYSILVFGLRRIQEKSPSPMPKSTKSNSEILLTHSTFLLIVIGWVWLALKLKPHLPYFLTTEDSSHPYFGLAFLGILGLMCIEMIEQRWLCEGTENGASNPENSPKPTKSKS